MQRRMRTLLPIPMPDDASMHPRNGEVAEINLLFVLRAGTVSD